jgi:hypothetical protein
MQQSYLSILVAGWMILLKASLLAAQGGGGHTLFGDFRIDERQVSGVKPQAFQIVLCKVGSSVGSRQTVTNNGRYRFMDVQNGHYEIVVESDGLEIARIQILINERPKGSSHTLEEFTMCEMSKSEIALLSSGRSGFRINVE